MPWPITIKLLKTKDKEKILTAQRKMTHYIKRIIQMTKDFPSESMEAKTQL